MQSMWSVVKHYLFASTASEGLQADGAASSFRVVNRPPLNRRLSEALVQRHAMRRNVPRNVNAILVKFPKIDRALRQIKETFHESDEDKNDSLSLEEVKGAFEKLHVKISEAEMKEIYLESDLDHNGLIGLKEFILAIAYVYLVKPPQESGQGSRLGLPDVEAAFESIVDAFFFFDKNADGVLSKTEVARSFRSSLEYEKEGSHLLSLTNRFDEMDYDHNGECSFMEFVYAFVGWVGTADEEDEEDEE